MRMLPATILLVLLIAVPAQAQWDPNATGDLGAGYGQTALSQSILSGTRGDDAGGKPRSKKRVHRPKRATARQLRALRFERDPAVTEGEYPRLTQVLLASCPPERAGCPVAHAQIIADNLPTGRLAAHFGANVRQVLRGSPDNLADVASTFVVLIWLTEHARPEQPDRLTDAQAAGARRFLRATRRAMALDRRLRRMRDAEQQRVADTLAVVAQHGINLHRTYLQLGQPEPAGQLREYLRGVAERWLGVDVASLRLTKRGFARR